MLHDRELAIWAAAFYEGEGTVGCYSGTWPRIMISIGQKNREPLVRWVRFLNELGIQAKLPNKDRRGFTTVVIAKYPDVNKVYKTIKPFLSKRRKRQFETAIDDFLSMSVRYGTRTPAPYGLRAI